MNASTVALASFLDNAAAQMSNIIFNDFDAPRGVCPELTEQEQNEAMIDVMHKLRDKAAELKAEVEKFEKQMAPSKFKTYPKPFMSTSDLALEAAERNWGERDWQTYDAARYL